MSRIATTSSREMILRSEILLILSVSSIKVGSAQDSEERLVQRFGKHERDAQGRLISLDRPNQELKSAELFDVSEQTSLRRLNLSFCKGLTNEGLQHLRHLYELRELNLGGCKLIDDAGLEHLRDLKKLEQLNISVTQVGDKSLQTIVRFARLKGLDLDNTSVTDNGLVELKALTDLEYLRLSELPIGDRAVETLLKLAKLKTLVLDGTGLTDAGFEKLARHERLDRLSVVNTQISSDALRRIKKSRATLRITGP